MHTGSRPKEWNATGDLGTNHSVPAHTKRGAKTSVGQALGAASTLVKTPPPITERMTPAPTPFEIAIKLTLCLAGIHAEAYAGQPARPFC